MLERTDDHVLLDNCFVRVHQQVDNVFLDKEPGHAAMQFYNKENCSYVRPSEKTCVLTLCWLFLSRLRDRRVVRGTALL
jgi:hypothetical protein